MAKSKSLIELTSERTQQAALAEPRPPRVIRVRLVDGETQLDALGRYWPVPAWARHLDGHSIGSVLAAVALALLALAGLGWAAWRLLGGMR